MSQIIKVKHTVVTIQEIVYNSEDFDVDEDLSTPEKFLEFIKDEIKDDPSSVLDYTDTFTITSELIPDAPKEEENCPAPLT